MWHYKEVFSNEAKDFTTVFKDFCLASLWMKEEVIRALQKVRKECLDKQHYEIFVFELDRPMKIDEYK
jgi:dynein heavy chain